MNYLLYKEAAIDPATQNQIVGAVGGGALGYLMTRYGLGIKGVGAGLTGAGMGSTLGALGGGYLSDYGKERNKQEKVDDRTKKNLQKMVDEPWTDTFRRHGKSSGTLAASAAIGAAAGYKADDKIAKNLDSRASALATDFRGAVNSPKVADKLSRKRIDSVLLEKVVKKLKGGKRGSTNNKAIELAAQRAGKDLPSDSLRRLGVRGKRGGLAGLLAYFALTGGQTTLDRKIFNPRRMQTLNTQGNN